MIGYAAFKMNCHLYFAQEAVPQAMFYYAAGYFIAQKADLQRLMIGGGKLWVSCLLLIATFAYAQFVPCAALASNNFGWLLPSMFGAFLGTYATFHLATAITAWGGKNPIRMFCTWAGKSTLLIMGLSGPVNMTIKFLSEPLLGGLPHPVNMVCRHTILWITLYLLSIVILRYAPVLLGKKRTVASERENGKID